VKAGAPVRRFAPAKVNLFLHVGAKRPDGYHDLASLIVFADVGDRLEVREARQMSLRLSGPFAKPLEGAGDNLVLRAARELDVWAEERGHKIAPVEIALEKNLPVASGIGGGSSDAAAALLMLAEFWSLPIAIDELQAIGLALGADVPVCVRGAPTLVTGLGEILTPVEGLPPFGLVLTNPGVEVPTAQIFKALDTRSGVAELPSLSPPPATVRDLAMLLDRTTNDLAPPAKRIAPAIMRVEAAIASTDGCFVARMSGSGATCFGLYESKSAADAAAAVLSRAHPSWWVCAAQTCVMPNT
jgi:4-diphosphocytidyl-2-C-methyl-D-erythritol kinase